MMRPAPTIRSIAPLALVPWLVLVGGCVFRDAGEPRFYRPESSMIEGRAIDPSPASGVPVRLAPVNGTPFLRERIAWRVSEVEYGLYEQRRWTELPPSYVERGLATALRDTPGVRLTDDFRAPTLRVDLVAFDEVLAPVHAAVVELVVSLRDGERRRLLDRTYSAETPIAGDSPSATATAIGRSLDTVVTEVAAAVGAALSGTPTGATAP